MEPIHFSIENFDKNLLIVYKSGFKWILTKIIKLVTIKFSGIKKAEFKRLRLEE